MKKGETARLDAGAGRGGQMPGSRTGAGCHLSGKTAFSVRMGIKKEDPMIDSALAGRKFQDLVDILARLRGPDAAPGTGSRMFRL
jgi:hypothetical protein